MESICDATVHGVSRQNKIEHLSHGTPFEIAKAQKKDAGSKQADLQSGIQTHLCNLFPNIRRERKTQCNLHAEVKSIVMRNSPEFSEG